MKTIGFFVFFRDGMKQVQIFRVRNKARFILFLTGSILALSFFAFDAPRNQAQKVLRHDAAAVVKLVPVRVLDAAGGPVRGLKKEDFTLSDNDELKTITEFEVYVSGESRVAADAAAMTKTQAGPEAKRKYFFVLDMQGSDLSGNLDSKKTVLEFVENQLKPGDEASVMTFGSLTGLVLRQYLTSDLEKIKKAVSRSIEMGGGGGEGGNFASGGGGAAGEEAGVAEIVTPGRDAFVFPTGDHEALAAMLLALCDTPERGAALGAEGERTARERFEVTAMVRRIEALYQSPVRA